MTTKKDQSNLTNISLWLLAVISVINTLLLAFILIAGFSGQA